MTASSPGTDEQTTAGTNDGFEPGNRCTNNAADMSPFESDVGGDPAAAAGVPIDPFTAIMHQTGHKSTNQVRRDVRGANLVAADDAASLAN